MPTKAAYRKWCHTARQLHMGQLFGVANQISCAAISLGLELMAVTGCVMWRKCKPQRSLGAPSRERAAPPMRGWKTALALLGIVFPLMAATLVAVWLADRAIFGPCSARPSASLRQCA